MSTLPYETATSGEKALGEIQKLLRGFGCSKFGSMIDPSMFGPVVTRIEACSRFIQNSKAKDQ